MFSINGEQWWIKLVTATDVSLLMPNGRFAVGACDDLTKTIYINYALDDEDFEQVLCHEIVHAAMFAYNIRLEYHEEELLAEIISIFGEEIISITDVVFNRITKGRYQ